jgi:isopenicillin N synthase-like dioxygenase
VNEVPVIDIARLRSGGRGAEVVATAIDRACREVGFFCVDGHGASLDVLASLDEEARRFFARPEEEKAQIAMARAGAAWRGWFPLGGELTSGRPDGKEGLYFGEELDATDARVRSGLPLHGPNLFPADMPELRRVVTAWMVEMTELARVVMRGVAMGLGLAPAWFEDDLTSEPTVLFRIFRYPPTDEDGWGVGEHTDYGLLTILAQDVCGGLQVRGTEGWLDVPALPGVLVCNIGDMLDRMTGGRYRSTPHRVRNTSGQDRLSFPFFFDPGWDALVRPVPLVGAAPADDARTRWDGASVHRWEGTYGDYLLGKVGKVFPDLADDTRPDPSGVAVSPPVSTGRPGVGEASVGQAAGGPAPPGTER